jgi:DNA-binding GntR family transcriptional regulator
MDVKLPIKNSNSQAHAAFQEVKQKILAGYFTEKDRLREVELAELLSLGRTPVREALKRLEGEGLLTRESRRGLVLTTLDQQAVTELYAMREVLEGAAAAFAARSATDAEIANMASILQEQIDGGDPVQLNQQFHQAIYGAAHNRHLTRSLQSLTDTTYLLGRSTLAAPDRAVTAQQEHGELLQAIRARDGRLASDLAQAHIRNALLERLKMLRQRPV